MKEITKWQNEKLTLVISETYISFGTFVTTSEACLDEHLLRKDGFKRTCHSLKIHKASAIDKIHVNAIKSV